jgi:hypothetical protein
MKKIKYLSILGLSLILLTGCTDSVHRSLERSIEYYSTVVEDVKEQEAMLLAVANSKLASRTNDRHTISVDINLGLMGPIATDLVGYAYYNYDANSDTSTLNLDISGLSVLKANIAADQKLDFDLKLGNFQLFKQDNIQLEYDAKPLNELINLQMLSQIDKKYIKRYRASRGSFDFETLQPTYRAYIFDIDSNYLNEQFSNANIKFESDIVITFLSERFSFDTIEIVHMSGRVTINNTFSSNVKVFLYNVKPQS